MTRLSILALVLLAVAASAPSLAQTPVFEVRDAAGATLLFAINDDGTATCTNCVVTDALADGAVTPAKVSVPFYYDKAQLDENEVTVSVTDSNGSVTATCDDANDIPIAAECDGGGPNSPLTLTSQRYANWTSLTAPAEVECVVKRSGVVPANVRATILCLPVPGTGAPTLTPGLSPSPEQ